MDVDLVEHPDAHVSDDEDLSEEQIEQLLKQAEDRLRQKALSKDVNISGYTLPRSAKLNVSALPKPYVQITGDIARADSRRLPDEKQRKLANGGVRRVEDPLILKRKTFEVYQIPSNRSMPMRKIIPIISLSGVGAPSWLPSCTCESSLYIVTLRRQHHQIILADCALHDR